MRKIFKGFALTIVALSLGMTTPVHADVAEIENAFKDLNGDGGTIQVSEFSPYEGSKNLRIIETVDVSSDNANDFMTGIVSKIKEIGTTEGFEYDCVYCDIYMEGYPEVTSTAIYNFPADRINLTSWSDEGSISVYRISDMALIKKTGSLTDVSASDSQSVDDSNSDVTLGEQNAYKKALSYLDYTAFSYSGLIDQLEYEGFSAEEATYGADNCGADWNEQAAKKAQSYLEYTSFSRDGLIEQLEYEGFTKEQAEYGVAAVGF